MYFFRHCGSSINQKHKSETTSKICSISSSDNVLRNTIHKPPPLWLGKDFRMIGESAILVREIENPVNRSLLVFTELEEADKYIPSPSSCAMKLFLPPSFTPPSSL